jgi:hypothetical protein
MLNKTLLFLLSLGILVQQFIVFSSLPLPTEIEELLEGCRHKA